MVTEKVRGSVEKTDMVEHGILCTLALSKKMKDILKDFKSEEDQHKALKDWLEDEPTGTSLSKGGRKKALRSTQKGTRRKRFDYYEASEDVSDESEEVEANKNRKEDTYRS